MSRREMGPEELRAIKESVNKEGTQMEEGEEGGAAVYIGTKEEVTKARQLAETEGKAPDLESYIVMHKQVVATREEIEQREAGYSGKDLSSLPAGAMNLTTMGDENFCLYYKDKEGSLAKVIIKLEKIGEFDTQSQVYGMNRLSNKLLGLGFKIDPGFSVRKDLYNVEGSFLYERRKKQPEAGRGFNF